MYFNALINTVIRKCA